MRSILFFLLIFTVSLQAELNVLQKEDIRKVMNEIFQQHVDKKEMTPQILKTALKSYIDQFDPNRNYLLEEEVAPYLHITDEKLANLKQQYDQSDWSIFTSLNQLIQKAITRSRTIRNQLEKDDERLFEEVKSYDSAVDEETRDDNFRRLFLKTPADLTNRWKQDIILFIKTESRRYGEGQATHNHSRTLSLFEHQLKDKEDTYLATDEKGNAVAASEKESLFTMHVLKSLASSFDAHTKVLNDQEAYDMKVRLEKSFPGIGVVLRKNDDDVFVSKVLENTPAANSHQIEVGDQLLEIDGYKIAGEPFEKVLSMVRGKKTNSYVDLVLLRNHQPIHLRLKRENIPVNEGRVEYSYDKYGNGIIGHITLHVFYQGPNDITSENDVRDAIANLEKQGNLRGLILDLRDNMGGFLTQAVRVAGLFMKSGVVVTSKYFNGEERVFRTLDDEVVYDGPLVILTSRETASAAEIVAQTLQDYGVAVVVGDEHTFGKGTIQSQTVTGDGEASFFKVTVGKYYTVSGKTPQLQGVKADVVVPSQISGELIGEEFLDSTIPPDTIPPAFTDSLSDVPASKRPWFLQYYAPQMQHKQKIWKSLIPTLQKNSAYRISHNKNYQTMLKKIDQAEVIDEETAHSPIPQNYGEDDLQLVESMNVLKDMVLLHSQNRGNELVDN